MMKLLTPCLLLLISLIAVQCVHEDNEFAEFEEFDDEMFETVPSKKDSPKIVMAPEAAAAGEEEDADGGADDDATVHDEDEEGDDDDDDDEFSHLGDKEEFEGFSDKKSSKQQAGDIQFVKVPVHLHTSWEDYSIEVLMLAGLLAYVLNYLAGKARNQKIAEAWFSAHKQLLEENFSVVGDDGVSTEGEGGTGLVKETDNVFTLWCSGRTCCEGMLVTIKLLKRQDLVSVISSLFRPSYDQIHVRVELGEMETMVFCMAHKRIINKLHKENDDLATFCVEKRSGDKLQQPSHLHVLTESLEVAAFVLDTKVSAAVRRFEEVIEYMHFSDQYCPSKNNDDNQENVAPEKSKVLLFCFNVSRKQGGQMDQLRPLMQMVFYCVDKLKRLKLPRESKLKAERIRQRALEQALKAGHVGRNEAAQNRKEERRRMEKEKIMNEDDPDKQRKLEEKNLKKEAKKKQPRMKRMKIKSM